MVCPDGLLDFGPVQFPLPEPLMLPLLRVWNGL